MSKSVLKDLVAELKTMLKAAIDAEDFSAVWKYSNYIQALTETGAAAKPGPKPGPKPVVKGRRGRPPGSKKAAVAVVGGGVKRRGRRQTKYKSGAKLQAMYNGKPMHVTVVEAGFEYKGKVYPSLRNMLDTVAGPGKATGLRHIQRWEPAAGAKPSKQVAAAKPRGRKAKAKKAGRPKTAGKGRAKKVVVKKKQSVKGGKRGRAPKHFFQPNTLIRATHKGSEYVAKVMENGHYELNGEKYPSLYALSVKLQGKAGALAAAKNWKPVSSEG
ncbi:MAG: DUF2924 domain-containing protein [Myxococcales bacterium]|nr:MAG: DUF2924 domain-containing protein [Myxococcales bacterium]